MHSPTEIYRFGQFQLIPSEHLLLKDGEPLYVTPTAFQVLVFFVENAGRLITKETLIREVWSDRFVEEGILSRNIHTLRKSLSDVSQPYAYIETIPKIGYRFVAPTSLSQSESPAREVGSIAVLRFTDAQADSNSERLSDAIADSLIGRLAEIPGLKVICRAISFRHESESADPRFVGRHLGVESVLSGRVSFRNDGLSVSIDLVDAGDGTLIWSGRYEKSLAENETALAEIVGDTVQSVRSHFSSSAKRSWAFAQRSSDASESYRLYLKAQRLFKKWTLESVKESITYYGLAIRNQPEFAQAYCSLGEAYAILGWRFVGSPTLIARAKTLIARALELDPALAEGHAMRAAIMLFHEWDWDRAATALEHALKLDPNCSLAWRVYSRYLCVTGQLDESVEFMKRAHQVDPTSPITATGLGASLLFAQRYDEALSELQKTLELAPVLGGPRVFAAQCYRKKGDYESAIDELKLAEKIDGDHENVLAELVYTYAEMGRKSDAVRLFLKLQERAKQTYVNPDAMALACVGLRRYEDALAFLHEAYRQRHWNMITLRLNPSFAPLQSRAYRSRLVACLPGADHAGIVQGQKRRRALPTPVRRASHRKLKLVL